MGVGVVGVVGVVVRLHWERTGVLGVLGVNRMRWVGCRVLGFRGRKRCTLPNTVASSYGRCCVLCAGQEVGSIALFEGGQAAP